MKTIGLRIAGFLIGLAVGAAVMFLGAVLLSALFQRPIIPRGIGWFVMIFLFAYWTSKAAPTFWVRLEEGKLPLFIKFKTASTSTRAVVVLSVFWICAVGLFVFLFNPYGYMYQDDYAHMLKVMIYPPTLGVAGLIAYVKLFALRPSLTTTADPMPLPPDQAPLHSLVQQPKHPEPITRETEINTTEAIILHAPDRVAMSIAERDYLNRIYGVDGEWVPISQDTVHHLDKTYDRLEIGLKYGTPKMVWFDITASWKSYW